MRIISAYVREDWYYSVESLKTLFSFTKENYQTEEAAKRDLQLFIKDLLSRNVLKIRKANIAEDEVDIEFYNYTDDDLIFTENKYKFAFVGIIICRSRIIYAYPKYIGKPNKLPTVKPVKELAQVIRVIEKYSKEKSKQEVRNINLFVDEEDTGKINTLSVMLFLLEDYTANGPYENDETIIEINGNGSVLWQKTVDETYPFIKDNRPYYTELYTCRDICDEDDYFKRLHEYVVTRCSHEIEIAGLTSFFSLPIAEISDDEENAFGEPEYIVSLLETAIATTYDDRKLSVLKAMKAYFNSSKILVGDTELQLIGTRSFNLIWEEVCAKVYSSQKGDSRTRHPNVNEIEPRIDYTLINKAFDKKPPTLVELIKQPIWKRYSKESKGIPKETFNPDYLRFEMGKTRDKYIFYILDAKYYCPVWTNESIQGQPGVEDVAKQYLYFLAYKEVLEKYNVTEVKNYFLMPKRKDDVELPGYVKMDILKDLGLGIVEVRMLHPEFLFENYLNNKQLNLSDLH